MGYFADRGDYRLESETPEKLCFRASRAGLRIARMWEDRITVTPSFGGVELEGPAKDADKLAAKLTGYKIDIKAATQKTKL